jgi:hypothetical protein
VKSLPQEDRHPADYRDEIEHSEVAAALSELPEDHPARVAYREGRSSDSIGLSHLVADRPDVVKRLVDAYLGHNARIWSRYSGAGAVARG